MQVIKKLKNKIQKLVHKLVCPKPSKKKNYWVYDKTFEKTDGIFRVDKRIFALSKYVQERNRKVMYPENDSLSDEDMLRRFSKIGSPILTKEQLLIQVQPMGGSKLSWDEFKAQHIRLRKGVF